MKTLQVFDPAFLQQHSADVAVTVIMLIWLLWFGIGLRRESNRRAKESFKRKMELKSWLSN